MWSLLNCYSTLKCQKTGGSEKVPKFKKQVLKINGGRVRNWKKDFTIIIKRWKEQKLVVIEHKTKVYAKARGFTLKTGRK